MMTILHLAASVNFPMCIAARTLVCTYWEAFNRKHLRVYVLYVLQGVF